MKNVTKIGFGVMTMLFLVGLVFATEYVPTGINGIKFISDGNNEPPQHVMTKSSFFWRESVSDDICLVVNEKCDLLLDSDYEEREDLKGEIAELENEIVMLNNRIEELEFRLEELEWIVYK